MEVQEMRARMRTSASMKTRLSERWPVNTCPRKWAEERARRKCGDWGSVAERTGVRRTADTMLEQVAKALMENRNCKEVGEPLLWESHVNHA